MKLYQIRNATLVIEVANHHILVDPMLSPPSSLPRFRYFGGNHSGNGNDSTGSKGNPLVPLPGAFKSLKKVIDLALITHCQKGHVDHLDTPGLAFLKRNGIRLICGARDRRYLEKKGLTVEVVGTERQDFLGGSIQTVPARHGRGFMALLMEHGVGYFLRLPGQPSLYIMGDSVLTPRIREFVLGQQPDYIVAATGMAQFDIGAPILMNEGEILELVRISRGRVIANHMGALDHCRIDRRDLNELLIREGLEERVMIPTDGEMLGL